MAKNIVWQDDYWLPLLQLYMKRPVGVKPTYCRDMVALSMELHIAPTTLAARMQQIAQLSTPRVEHFWQTYSDNPRRLKRAVSLWREMRGFGAASAFYEGVNVSESFERDFQPLKQDQRLMPIMLILILDLYFRLTPNTMVSETPEVQELARLVKLPASLVVDILAIYQVCDPYLNRQEGSTSELFIPCKEIWKRFGNEDMDQLAAIANELKAYFQ
jgi:hypothetical protein